MEFTKVTSNNEADNRSMMVVLWDLGPSKPVQPKRPKAPTGKEGDPAFELAKVEFAEELEEYQAEMKAHKQAKIDFAEFEKRYGGPYEIPMWSCDANDALERGQGRYCISSKTRGYEKTKNGGLPEGVKPGHGQAENERREREGIADFEAARRSDPVFGAEVRT